MISLSTLREHYIDSESHEETDMLARLVGPHPISLGLGRGTLVLSVGIRN